MNTFRRLQEKSREKGMAEKTKFRLVDTFFGASERKKERKELLT